MKNPVIFFLTIILLGISSCNSRKESKDFDKLMEQVMETIDEPEPDNTKITAPRISVKGDKLLEFLATGKWMEFKDLDSVADLEYFQINPQDENGFYYASGVISDNYYINSIDESFYNSYTVYFTNGEDGADICFHIEIKTDDRLKTVLVRDF